ncbi:pre-peptidase C-terminal domain-containing protein [Leptolyngbya sp. FACHB-261]|uniref:pre-peptidase C-terminal domain-containing protein n=1 Tax=Leptolyngbya sp. FACHB-261 TaxID=2692806 RepID=UPI001686F09C|nr:pre-peptidase C-terminal domain-containing protein [Leptolyngbya sp. FACHB-261]MBD2103739.1 pre-peptidase C-terminal domain-containing protein [Leptolyngbya sp. FACHB-261]
MLNELHTQDSNNGLNATLNLSPLQTGISGLDSNSATELGLFSSQRASTRDAVGFSSISLLDQNVDNAELINSNLAGQSWDSLTNGYASQTASLSTSGANRDGLTGLSSEATIVGDAAQGLRAEPSLTVGAASALSDGNDSLATALNFGKQSHGATKNRNDLVDSSDPIDYYRFRLTRASGIKISLKGLTADADLHLINGSGVEIARSVRGGTLAEAIGHRGLEAGTYYIQVNACADAQTGYQLNLQTSAPDAGNHRGSASHFGSFSSHNRVWNESIGSKDVNDFYRFDLLQRGSVNLALTKLRADADLRLLGSNGGEIARSVKGGSLAESINRNLDAGTYYIRVNSFGSTKTGYNIRLATNASAANVSATSAPTDDWFSQNLLDTGVINQTRTLASDGQLNRNDMLALFRNIEDGSVIDANERTDLQTLVNNSARFNLTEPVRWLTNQVAVGTSANMSANQFESNLVGRWFLGTVAPTAQFNQTALIYSHVQGSLFGSAGQAQIGDIDQGQLGDCAFLAALAATFTPANAGGNSVSAVINNMITDNGDSTYTMRFFSNGSAEYTTVDRRLATLNGNLFGASANGSVNPNYVANVLWAPLVERAYAQWREWHEGQPGYNLIGNGDHPFNSLSYVTGRPTAQFGAQGSAGSFESVSFNQIAMALQSNQAVELGRYNPNSTTSIMGGHAYTLTNAYSSNGQQRIVVRNPWGTDGRAASGDANDGYIDLSFAEFRSSFDSITFA